MSLREDLIAAKALIDSPEKLDTLVSVRSACTAACGHDTPEQIARANAAFMAVLEQPGTGRPYVTHEDIMDRMDRTIAAAGDA